MYIVHKSRPSSKAKVKGQRPRLPGTKKRKATESSPLSRMQQAATDDTICVAARGWRATSVGKSAHAV